MTIKDKLHYWENECSVLKNTLVRVSISKDIDAIWLC
jgi:hypothetical protein